MALTLGGCGPAEAIDDEAVVIERVFSSARSKDATLPLMVSNYAELVTTMAPASSSTDRTGSPIDSIACGRGC